MSNCRSGGSVVLGSTGARSSSAAGAAASAAAAAQQQQLQRQQEVALQRILEEEILSEMDREAALREVGGVAGSSSEGGDMVRWKGNN